MTAICHLRPSALFACVAAIFFATTAKSATLQVGPSQKYSLPSAAISAASDGDTILVDPAGHYDNDVALIAHNHLTIRSTGPEHVTLKSDGRVYGRKGIWLFAEHFTDLTIDGFDFSGARVSKADGENGAGLRSQGENLTLTHCRFTDNQDGLLGGGGTTTIEHCEFDHNGSTGQTHNVYINDKDGRLIFRFNYSHDTAIGHLLKSRSAKNTIAFNRLTDDAGTGSYELDLPNGGECDLIGNIIRQSPRSQNSTIIAFGEEGTDTRTLRLSLSHNTIINDKPTGTFIDANKAPATLKLISRNNLFVGPGKQFAWSAGQVDSAGDLHTTLDRAGFVNSAHGDYHLTSASPASGAGVNLTTTPDLIPTFQWLNVNDAAPRLAAETPDVGAMIVRP
ncbi:MAG: right-handed parallel beta-helix repeat-containing protein [Phycisphaerae bacterium]|nr:right-handed parallel beta-helix repeat-containing protein [Phycisphaerae bacterium]